MTRFPIEINGLSVHFKNPILAVLLLPTQACSSLPLYSLASQIIFPLDILYNNMFIYVFPPFQSTGGPGSDLHLDLNRNKMRIYSSSSF